MAQLRRPEVVASPRLVHIERAWLDAASNGDVDQMKNLRNLHPRWLNLNRKIDDTVDGVSEDTPGDSDWSRSSGFCSWDGFHLRTIGASALHTATWHGDNKIVEYLLEEGQDPDTEDDTGMSAIMLAIMHHNLQATRCVFRDRVAIQRNLVTDCQQEDNERSRDTVGRIQIFLHLHANVDKRCHRGKTALHHATTDETYEVASLLISNGASIDAQDEEGKSPLHHCIQPTSLLVADLLLQHGANVHLPDNNGVTSLQLVIRTHDVNMLQVILNQHQFVATKEGEDFAGSVLLTAVDEGVLDVVKYLLEDEYMTVEHQNGRGETPMHRAILNQRDAVTELLRTFDEQARVLILRTESGESCLHYAARYSSPEELQSLLTFYRRPRTEMGAAGQLGGGGRTGEEEAMALLNSVNSAGSTALFVAATSKADSLEHRSAKTQLMLGVGACLLGGDPLLDAVTGRRPPPAIMVLSTEVQTCLWLWLSECVGTALDDVTKFCIEYLAIVYSLHHPQLLVSHEVLEVLLSSGQAVDTAPLLLLLPFDRRASLPLFEHIGVFGRQQGHSLILALYEELAAAWTGLVA